MNEQPRTYLEQYIEERNMVRRLCNLPEWDINDQEHRYQINQALIVDLNPEVMSCDGEADKTFVAFRKFSLLVARRDLLKYDEMMNKNQPFTTDFVNLEGGPQ